MRFKYKFFIYVLALLISLLFSQGFFFKYYHNKQKHISASDKIVNIIKVLAGHMSAHINEDEDDDFTHDMDLINNVRNEFNIKYLAVFDKKGEFITDFRSKKKVDFSFIESASSEKKSVMKIRDSTVEISVPIFKENGKVAGFAYANYDMVFAVDNDKLYKSAYRSLFVIYFAIAVVMTILLGWYILHPLVIITQFIKNYNKDSKKYDMSYIKKLKTDKEFKDIAVFIETMVSKVEYAESSRTEVLENISHELRTPMHAIMGYVELLEDEDDELTTQEKSKIISSLHENGDRLLTLINNLLDLSKLGNNKFSYLFKTFDLTTVINKVLSQAKPLYSKKSISVSTSFYRGGESIKIWGDESRLYQVIWNVLGNAIKFSNANTKIHIVLASSKILTSDEREIEAVSISIEDEGGGVPEDELEEIFNPFVQSSETKTGAGGTGLGLAISKEVVDGHNGTIFAENTDKGARFIITLPVHARNRR